MRLWTIHPRYLDARGLVALWREALLAKHKSEPAPSARERAPNVPPPLDELVASLLAKTPMGRPVDAHAVAARLADIAASLSIALPDRSAPEAPPAMSQVELTRLEVHAAPDGRPAGHDPPGTVAERARRQ